MAQCLTDGTIQGCRRPDFRRLLKKIGMGKCQSKPAIDPKGAGWPQKPAPGKVKGPSGPGRGNNAPKKGK